MPFPAWPELSADALEQQMLARWADERLFERSLERTQGNLRSSSSRARPPPTAGPASTTWPGARSRT